MRVLIYSEVNINVISGPSQWTSSVVELFAGGKDVNVDVLLLTPLTNQSMIAELSRRASVTIVDPWQRAQSSARWKEIADRAKGRRLTPPLAAAAIRLLDEAKHFDLIVIRGMATADNACAHPRLASRIWAYDTDPDKFLLEEDREVLRRVAAQSRRLLVQTSEAAAALRERIGDDRGEISILPPMIPEIRRDPIAFPDPDRPRLVYAGKFTEGYLILEQIEAFREIRKRIPAAEFHVMGANFNCSADYADEVRRQLCATEGILWYGDVPAVEADNLVLALDISSSWRSAAFDNNLELSSKVLMSGAAGKPVLMNPNVVQVRIFGESYPGYVVTQHDFVERFIQLVNDRELFRRAAEDLRGAAANYTIARVRETLLPLAHADAKRAAEEAEGSRSMRVFPLGQKGETIRGAFFGNAGDAVSHPVKMLIAGRDLKFASDIIRHFERKPGCELRVENWDVPANRRIEGGDDHDDWADIIFCEWAHSSAEWYSLHKHPRQKLVVRLHRYELEQPHLERIDWNNVDRVIFVAEHIRSDFLQRFPLMESRAVIIRNTVDCDAFALPKNAGSEFRVGFLGVNPPRKAPHLAFRIHDALYAHDPRFRLCIKGKAPWEIDWLWSDQPDRAYYENLYIGANGRESMQGIVLSPQGPDVADWFRDIGFILSTSVHEGSHQAVAEGMASGCLPVVRGWDGADWQYPAKYIHPYDEDAFVSSATRAILEWAESPGLNAEGAACAEYVRTHFDLPLILGQYDALMTEVLASVRVAGTI
jgi:glycosyltransferase involved in cell wall biosynthesis